MAATKQQTQTQQQAPEQAMTRPGEAKPAPVRKTLADMLEASKQAIQSRLPSHMNADRIIKVAFSACGRNAELGKCTQQSIIKAVMLGAELGLEAGGLLGEAYLVPFNNKYVVDGKEVKVAEATLIPGYRGLIKLARQSGEVSQISAQVVYEMDKYAVHLGLEPDVEHIPLLTGERGKLLFCYAGVKYKDGGRQMEVMTRSDVMKIKGRSKTGKYGKGPWGTDEAEMWRKTVLRRLLKYAPLSSERLMRAQEVDSEVDVDLDAAGVSVDVPVQLEGAPTPAARSDARASALAGRIQQNQLVPADVEDEPPPGVPVLDDTDDLPSQEPEKPVGVYDPMTGKVDPPEPEYVPQEPPPGAGDAWEPPTKGSTK